MLKKIRFFLVFIFVLILLYSVFPVRLQAQSIKWVTNSLGGNIVSSPAIGPDGYIYSGAFNGYIYKIDPVNGNAQPIYSIGSNIYSTPAIAPDGTVYVGSLSNRIYAINPDGGLVWTAPVNGGVYSSPAIGSDGTVYVGTTGGYMHAFNPDGSLKWPAPAYVSGPIFSSPAVAADGIVIAATTNGRVYALNGTDGAFAWLQPYNSGVAYYASPVMDSDGTIYLMGYNNGYLYALTSEGSLKWQYPVPGGSGGYYNQQSSPAIGPDGTIYVGAYSSGRLCAINPSGPALKWYYSMGTTASSPAVGADGTIYIGTNTGYLFGISDLGSINAGWPYGGLSVVVSSPVIDEDGTIYIGSMNGRLYAFNGTSGGPADSVWPMFGNNAQRTGSVEIQESDSDFDGIPDTEDNCPSLANPNQEDADSDSTGDVCDVDTVYGYISGDVQEGVIVDINILSCGLVYPTATTITDAEGYYSMGGLEPGNYILGPKRNVSYYFTPVRYQNVLIPQAVIQSYDFTAIAN